ncbi:MAG: hypothetical protein JWL87_318 [Candidatus Adlerbacteria bacterium]|nr:hypothetical protein [Candidatus Adlerbacteria bacterium]
MPTRINPLTLYRLYVRRVVAALGAAIAVCAFMYGFFLLEAVSHAASQAQARREVGQLSSKVGKLQAQYLAATKALTPERARAMGFVEPAHVATVYADAHALTLSANR